MKFILIFLFLFSNFAFANVKHCQTYLRSLPNYLKPHYGVRWSMDEQGKLKREDIKFLKGLSNSIELNPVFNLIENKNGTINLEEVNKEGFKNQVVLSLDSMKRIIKIDHNFGINPDDMKNSQTTFFSYKNDVCYPALVTSTQPGSGNELLAHTALCQELREYLLNVKDKEEPFKCVCGTDKTNNDLTGIFKRHSEIDLNGEIWTYNYDSIIKHPQGTFSLKDKDNTGLMSSSLTPSHKAIQVINICFSFRCQ